MTDGRHAKRVQKKSTPDESDIQVRYSPKMRRAFARIEAAVHNSEHFDEGILENLELFTEDRPWSLQDVLNAIATVVHCTMEHVAATHDAKAREALTEFLVVLGDEPPVKIMQKRERGAT
jgi:hypothetical protein